MGTRRTGKEYGDCPSTNFSLKVALVDRNLQIYERGDHECSTFQPWPEIIPKWRILSCKFCISGRTVGQENEIFLTG